MTTITPAAPRPVHDRTALVRRFNRFYTSLVGALDEGHLASPFTLVEVRVLYEIAHRDAPTAAEIARDLRLDQGYLSRILRDFARRDFVRRDPSAADARRSHLHLTDTGREAFAELEARARDDVSGRLTVLPDSAQHRLVAAMATIESLLGATPTVDAAAPVVLRPPRPGDLGWVVQRHGALYAEEYGWDARFEALVARIVGEFIERMDETRERCWIAEHDGANAGCIFLVRHPDRDGVAKLRLLLVEPSARGLGIGARLVDECLTFARAAGYRTVTLWTNSVLHSARKIYEAVGFRLVHEEAHSSFGHGLIGQTWELEIERS